MKLWMNVMRDLESVMNDHEDLFDAWAEGGVDGLVIGPMIFNAQKLLPGTIFVQGEEPPAATFDPYPEIYRRLGVEPPSPPADQPEKRRLLEKALSAAKERGFTVALMYTDAGHGPGDGFHLYDETTLRARVARMIDTLEHYPMADVAVMDGPEWGTKSRPTT